MNFTSLTFLIIVVSTIALYYVFPKDRRWYVLLAASVCFYLYAAGAGALIVTLLTAVFVWGAALRMERESDDRRKKRLYLSVAVVIVTGLLVLFKLKRYFAPDFKLLIVPLGVSYYTLSLIGYLFDVFYKKERAERSLPKLCLYTLFFPKIIQGPISKFRELGPRLIEGHPFDYERFCFGLQRVLWGYFKKLIIADRMAEFVELVFGNIGAYNDGSAVLLFATFIATVRHYCDFSGYMDIVVGISQTMGIELDENFRQPFFSRSAAEFWRRWHITLGTWFKDYVYMQLVIHPRVIQLSGKLRKRFGKRAGKSVLTIVPLAVVWLLTGLWHGTGIDYIIWGVYWGTIIILTNVFAPEINRINEKLHIPTESLPWRIFQTIRTFAIFVGGLLISTFVGWRNLGAYFSKLLSKPYVGRLLQGTSLYIQSVRKGGILLVCIATVLLLVIEFFQQRGSIRAWIARQKAPVRWCVYAAFIAFVLLFGFGFGGLNDMRDFDYAYF